MVPLADDPNFAAMTEEANELFNKYNLNGKVRIECKTKMFFGRFR